MNSFLLFCIVCFTCAIICSADSGNILDACPTSTTAKETIFVNGFPCKNPLNIAASDFKTSEMRNAGDTDNLCRSSVTLITASDFPGLNTLGLSIARTDLEIDGLVMPHSHPRAAELFFVFEGVVTAGFIDTNNQIFEKKLLQGDVMVFPRGLLHYCYNNGFESAIVYSMLNSQNPGVVSIINPMIGSDFDVINKVVRTFISVFPDNLEQNATFSRFLSAKSQKHSV